MLYEVITATRWGMPIASSTIRPDPRSSYGGADPVAIRGVGVTEPGARYIDFLIPGLLGLNIMGTGMWGVGFGIVKNRTEKLLV